MTEYIHTGCNGSIITIPLADDLMYGCNKCFKNEYDDNFNIEIKIMNIYELNLVKQTHEKMMLSILNIIEKHIDIVKPEMIKDLENYNDNFMFKLEKESNLTKGNENEI